MIKAPFSIFFLTGHLHLKISLILVFLSLNFSAQPPQFKVYNYIEKYRQAAVDQMIAYRIPASVILAQAIFESSSGTSVLAKKSNNHFGIKCHRGWEGDTIVQHDDTLNECFRSYTKIEDSYTDHSLFLVSRPRYSGLFKLAVNDYKNWCIGLKMAGYATAPRYAEQLIELIEETKLYELDGSENLITEIRRFEEEEEIKPSIYTGIGFSVRDFSKSGALWVDPKTILVKSLDFVVKQSNNSEIAIAGR